MNGMVEFYKKSYPEGTRIELEFMGDDPRPIAPGTRGTVRIVDDMGTVHCDFDNGRCLGLIPGEDSFRKLTVRELAEEQQESVKREYTLHIRRYDRYMTFDNIDDLKDEVKGYFTAKEQASGIVDRLTNFETKNKDGYYRNSYQDFEVCCYEIEADISKKPGLDSQIQSAAGRTAAGTTSKEAPERER